MSRLTKVLGCFLTVAHLAFGGSERAKTIVDWRSVPPESFELTHAKRSASDSGWLALDTVPGKGRAGVKVRLSHASKGVAGYARIVVPVRNLGSNDLRIILRVDDSASESLPTTDVRKATFQACVSPGPEPVSLEVWLGDNQPSAREGKFLSMVGQPVDFVRRGVVNANDLSSISVFTPDPKAPALFSVGEIKVVGAAAPYENWPAARIFPVVDKFGQYAHWDWPNKIHSAAEMNVQRQTEEASLDGVKRPAAWNKYGGWDKGIRLPATGFFRVEKLNGAWWFVDPEGRLFWSHGVVRVGTRVRVGSEYRGTPLPDRENYFHLPERNSEFGVFYSREPQSTRRYYVGRDNHEVYDFLEANLFRKYGPDWRSGYAVQAQRRLASWGLNTIANSSDPEIYRLRKTPYTAIVYSAPLGRSEFRLQGSEGNWGKLPDPFDSGWCALITKTLKDELSDSLKDPWCIGFFVDNELNWGDSNYLAAATLRSPSRQPAKVVLTDRLKKQYKTIAALNKAWAASYSSWDDLTLSTNPPVLSTPAVNRDFSGFSTLYIEAYFRGCREAIKSASPNHLYMGCRFASSGNPLVMRAAAEYCDVVSINRYAQTVEDLKLPEGLDRPILIGEFHFTTMAAPMQPSGLVMVANHTDRARAYRTYVTSALRNPTIIGTHWFQYYDQPATGRFDGENYQTGLLDICDTPYEETTAACRLMGERLYEVRTKAFPGPTQQPRP
jgi:hypothetical protein